MFRAKVIFFCLTLLVVLGATLKIGFAEEQQIVVPTYRPAATVTVSDKGIVVVKNAVVFLVSGKTIYVRTYWGDSYVRFAVRIGDRSEIVKRFGGKIEVADIKVGHILDIDGVLVSGSDSLNVDATLVRDLTLEKENAGFSGKVTRADNGSNTFVLTTSDKGDLLVKSNSNTVIKKGAIYIPFSKVVYGDTILSVNGIYHEPTKTIEATDIAIYQTPKVFESRNFQGELKSLSGVNLPATLVIFAENVNYTVYLPANTEILTAKRDRALLQRFVAGDRVRFYGKIRETNLTEVDAEVVRNLDL